MKKLIPLFIVVIVVVWYVAKPSPLPSPAAEKIETPLKVTENVTLPSARAKTIFQAPRARLAVPQGATTKECENFFGALREVDISKLRAPIASPEGLPKGTGCEKVPEPLAASDAAYRDACLKPRTDAQACTMALFFYRASLTDWLTRATPVADITDPAVLTDKLFAKFVTDPASAADVAERLLDLEPDLYPAAKAALLSRLMDAQKNAQGKPNDPRWNKMDDLFPRAERNGREDSDQLFELRMVKDLMRNPKPDYGTMAKDSDDYARAHPESGVGPYNQAMVAFRQGDRAAALEFLNQANGREKNPRYAETAERIKKGEAEPFRTNLSFSLDPNKYLR